jgi:hypothetical protein
MSSILHDKWLKSFTAEQCPRRTLGFPRGVEIATIEAIELPAGREKSEYAPFFPRDDPCGSVVNFNDIGLGHGISFAEMPALLYADGLCGELRGGQRQAPVAADTQRRVKRLHMSPTAGPGFDFMRRLRGR